MVSGVGFRVSGCTLYLAASTDFPAPDLRPAITDLTARFAQDAKDAKKTFFDPADNYIHPSK
jgi:hypothetical protein